MGGKCKRSVHCIRSKGEPFVKGKKNGGWEKRGLGTNGDISELQICPSGEREKMRPAQQCYSPTDEKGHKKTKKRVGGGEGPPTQLFGEVGTSINF